MNERDTENVSNSDALAAPRPAAPRERGQAGPAGGRFLGRTRGGPPGGACGRSPARPRGPEAAARAAGDPSVRPISAGFSADFNRTPFKLGRQLSRGCPPVVLMKRNRSGQAGCPLCLVLSNCPGLRLAGHSHQVAAEGSGAGPREGPREGGAGAVAGAPGQAGVRQGCPPTARLCFLPERGGLASLMLSAEPRVLFTTPFEKAASSIFRE